MFCQMFGKFLMEKEVINDEDYATLIKEQMSVRVRLGTIAIAEGLLSEEQVEQINQAQMSKDKRFGDIAVEEGLLTDEQVGALLKKQGDSYLQFVQLLTDLTDISKAALDAFLEEFRVKSGFTPQEMEALKKDDPDAMLPIFIYSSKPYVSDIAGLFLRNLTRFVSRDFYFERARKAKEYQYKYLAMQELSGDASIYLAIAEAEDNGAFLDVASSFSHQELDGSDEDSYDSVGEFINVTSGLFASASSQKNVNVDMLPPLGYPDQKATGDFYIIPIILKDRRLDLLIAVNSEFKAGDTPVKTGAVDHDSIDASSAVEGKRVLIVDDSRMSRRMLRTILENAGYSVIGEAENGRIGVEEYKKLRPDVTTLDITMPEMDGLEALEAILGFDKEANCVMITAAGQQDKLIRALKAGAKRFISKPFNEEEIVRNIQELA